MVSSTPRLHFTPGKDTVPIVQEAGWAPGPVWTGGKSRPHRNSIPGPSSPWSVAIPTELPGINLIVGVNSEFLSSVPSCPRNTLRSAVSQYFTGGRNVQGIIIPCERHLRIQTRPTCLPLFQHFISYNEQLLELISWKIIL